LVLFLFHRIPTGDPAIVAFYDKRIYKKVTIEVIVPKWPLISRKETASEYDKINNFAMIRRPFVTIEDQFLSVITVINMLHSFNQLIVYTIWKLAFSKLTKITPLTCPPFINTMYVTTWPISKKGNKWEMLLYEAWTDGRTAVCHNKPVFWQAYKNEWPISWNYEYIIFGQIIFQNFHQFKAFVGLSDRRTVGL
jgi:hypothetical protein